MEARTVEWCVGVCVYTLAFLFSLLDVFCFPFWIQKVAFCSKNDLNELWKEILSCFPLGLAGQ